MTRQFVFLVHGIGAHTAADWSDGWQTAILDSLRHYGEFQGLDPDEIRARHIEFVPIGYDKVFVEGYRDKWGDLAGALADQQGLPTDLATALRDLRDDTSGAAPNILWDYVLDALLWYGVPQARQAVIAHVNKQLGRALERMRAENGDLDRAHVIAHSLGTSVMHDAALCLSRGKLCERAYEGRNFKWRTLVMIANTSRVMQAWMPIAEGVPIGDFDVHESTVQPGRKRDLLVRRYFNVRNLADPVTWPRPFDPTAWDQSLYSDLEVRRYGALKEVHDFETYFRNPKVHVPVFRSIFGRNGLCSRDERDAAWRDFEQAYPKVAGTEFGDLRAIVNGDSGRQHSALELGRFLLKVFKELRQ